MIIIILGLELGLGLRIGFSTRSTASELQLLAINLRFTASTLLCPTGALWFLGHSVGVLLHATWQRLCAVVQTSVPNATFEQCTVYE